MAFLTIAIPRLRPGVPVALRGNGRSIHSCKTAIYCASRSEPPRKAGIGASLDLVLLWTTPGRWNARIRVQIIHEALRVLASQLEGGGQAQRHHVCAQRRRVGGWMVVSGTQAGQVAEEVSGHATGGTNLEDAMNLAYQTALRHYLANGPEPRCA